MPDTKEYLKIFYQIEDSMDFFRRVDNDNEMDKAYIDEYTTSQQKKRDRQISRLLAEYVEAYRYKNRSNKWYKRILFGVCILIISVFSVVFIILLFRFGNANQSASKEAVIELISVCITFLSLIVGILTIITKYVFPEDEEEYITRIVEIIQKNDLENKKENIKVKAAVQKITQDNIRFEEMTDEEI